MLIRKLFKAEMAHLVPGAYTKRCHFVHGHSYKYELFLKSEKPNNSQMVADFKGIKDIGVNDFFDSFDHAIMIWENDPLAKMADKLNPERHIIVPFVPTAEMMAKAFFMVARSIIETTDFKSGEQDVRVDRVIVHETETGYASFGESDLEEDDFPDIHFEKWIISEGIQKDWSNKLWYPRVLKTFESFLKTLR